MLFFQEMICTHTHYEKGRKNVGSAQGVNDLVNGERLGDNREEVREFRSSVSYRVPHGMLHPCVGDENPDGGKARCRSHEPDGNGVSLGRKPVPAQSPHGDKRGFKKKSHRGLDGQKGSEDISHVTRITGPVGAKLEFKGYSRYDSHGEVDQKYLAPEFGHSPVFLVPVLTKIVSIMAIRMDRPRVRGTNRKWK